MKDQELIIADLKSQLEVVTNENMLLAERAEDMTLMSVLTELASEIDDEQLLVQLLLERISMLKDIAFCACGKLENNWLFPFSTFCQFTNNDLNHKVHLAPEIFQELNDGIVFLKEAETAQLSFSDEINSHGVKFSEILLIPFFYQLEIPALFVFAGDFDTQVNSLGKYIDLLTQLVYLTENRINRLHLHEQLKISNFSLEKKLVLGTTQIKQKDESLKEETDKRKSAESNSNLNEEKFEKIFNSANDAIILWEIDEHMEPVRCIDVNAVFLELTGYTKEEILALDVCQLRGGGRNDGFMATGKPSSDSPKVRFEVLLKAKSGVEIPTEVSAHRFNLGEMKVSLAVHRDITERLKFQEKIIQEKNRAEESDRLKSVFLANMSHEIRTPMNAIMGFSELLQEKDLSEEEKHSYLSILRSKGDELLNLINDILYLSKIEANQIDIRLEPTVLNDFLQKSLLSWEGILQNRKKGSLDLKLVNSIPESTIIMVDANRLTQILNNLVGNAIKFTDKGKVTIHCMQKGEEVYFEIEDTGIGIPENKLGVVFGRFRQADESQTRQYGGTGLGLSICKQLVELMDGKIGVQSTLGVGSSFWFTLPYILS